MTALALDDNGAPLPNAALVAPETPEQAEVSLMWRWGKLMAASGYFNDAKGAAQAAVKIAAGRELGLPPATAMRSVYFFDGKLSLATALMTAKVNQSSNYEYDIVTKTKDLCLIKWWGKSKRTGGWRELGDSKFDNEDVTTAGLAGKDNHKKYPTALKFNRAMSAGCRAFCPELFNGAVYTPEEVGGDRVVIDEQGAVQSAQESIPTLVGASPSSAIEAAVRAARVAPTNGMHQAEAAHPAPAKALKTVAASDEATLATATYEPEQEPEQEPEVDDEPPEADEDSALDEMVAQHVDNLNALKTSADCKEYFISIAVGRDGLLNEAQLRQVVKDATGQELFLKKHFPAIVRAILATPMAEGAK